VPALARSVGLSHFPTLGIHIDASRSVVDINMDRGTGFSETPSFEYVNLKGWSIFEYDQIPRGTTLMVQMSIKFTCIIN